ncbi:cytochrome c oxidase assembly protein [Macrococcus equipercicus]|nr:cytochrome c oxidase assembly protein [Macrococcus equipercicus]
MNHMLPLPLSLVILAAAGILIIYYLHLMIMSQQRLRKWPIYRLLCWVTGIVMATAVMVGPLADRMHSSFILHMYGHLMLGMLAPLLLVLSAPMTLLLRSLQVKHARQVTRLLSARYVKFITHPVTAAILNVGGLWVLYRTDLYHLMHESLIILLLVHLHIFLAGYLFTAAFVYIDPIAHRFSFKYRAIVLIISLAAHQILAKSLYPYPPAGVSRPDAQVGAQVMYYGGDLIDYAIIFLLCLEWYKAVRPGKVIRQQ